MYEHWKALARLVPGLAGSDILDLGSGKGAFLVEAAKQGARAKGVECSERYIELTHEAAARAGVSVEVVKGFAESIPYPDRSFDFVNMGEVIEHVQDPHAMLKEVHRVLRPEGQGYMSVPNRFGMRDPHFRLYFVNWLPRSFAHTFISMFGTHKDYTDASAGLQDLTAMHYYTFGGIRRMVISHGFDVIDIRAHRIEKEFHGIKRLVASLVYPFARGVYFDSAHLLIRAKVERATL